jgi:hypothetical protein
MPEFVNLLMQIPLVGIFVWFTLKMLEIQEKANQERDEQWRRFLQDQAEQYNKGLARIAEEVKENTIELRKLKDCR